jgi:hypothetical protein
MDDILSAVLNQNANYREKQLIKAGRLEECLSSVLAGARRSTRAYTRISVLFAGTVVVIPMLSRIPADTQQLNYGTVALHSALTILALRRIFILVKIKTAQARMETLATIWRATHGRFNTCPETPESRYQSAAVVDYFSQ